MSIKSSRSLSICLAYTLYAGSNPEDMSITHWGRVTNILASKLTTIGSDNGLSPGRRQVIIWTNAGILLIEPLGRNFNEILIEIHTFLAKKIYLKMASGKWCTVSLGFNVIISASTNPQQNASSTHNSWDIYGKIWPSYWWIGGSPAKGHVTLWRGLILYKYVNKRQPNSHIMILDTWILVSKYTLVSLDLISLH